MSFSTNAIDKYGNLQGVNILFLLFEYKKTPRGCGSTEKDTQQCKFSLKSYYTLPSIFMIPDLLAATLLMPFKDIDLAKCLSLLNMLLTCILMYHAEMFTIKLNILIDTRCNV
jgi:hypothetical protein